MLDLSVWDSSYYFTGKFSPVKFSSHVFSLLPFFLPTVLLSIPIYTSILIYLLDASNFLIICYTYNLTSINYHLTPCFGRWGCYEYNPFISFVLQLPTLNFFNLYHNVMFSNLVSYIIPFKQSRTISLSSLLV